MSFESEQDLTGSELEETTSRSADTALLSLYVSVALAYVWYAICYLSFGVNQHFEVDDKGFLFYAPLACLFFGLLVSYLLVPRLSVVLDYGRRKHLVACLFCGTAAGITLLFFSLSDTPFREEILAALGCLILGVALGALALLSKEFACGLDHGAFNMCLCIAAVVGIGIFCLSSMIALFWQLVVFSVATFLAALAIFAFTSSLHQEDSPQRMPLPAAFKKLELRSKTGWFHALYGSVLGLESVEYLSLHPPEDFLMLVFSALGFSAGIIIALVVLLKNPHRMMLGQAQRFSFPFLIIGLLPWNLLSLFPSSLGFVWIFAICAVLVFITLDSHYFLSKKYDVPAIYSLTLAFRSFIKGLILGASLGIFLSVFWQDRMLVSLFGLIFVILLSFLISFIREESDRSAPKPKPVLSTEDMEPARRTGVWKKSCTELVAEYSLTPREGEILSLLLKAMTIERISVELFISAHTTKTHIYHIYQKMGVKNRGELSGIFQKRLDAAKKDQYH